MPYIDKWIRDLYDPTKADFKSAFEAGQLNFQLTVLCDEFVRSLGGSSYENYNRVIGVLECCKLEFYRRAVAPYEDKKIEQNGDVYV